MDTEPFREDEGTEAQSLETRSESRPRPVGIFLIGFLGVCVPSLALTALGIIHFGSRSVKQPVEFNHRKHVAELGIACDACHSDYEKETFAGLPKADVCAACHAEAQGSSEEERALVEKLKRGETLEWKRLFAQPPHVFYSHRRHVKVAKIACATCHGGIADTTSPPGKVRNLAMEDCIECHRNSKVSVACTTCHR